MSRGQGHASLYGDDAGMNNKTNMAASVLARLKNLAQTQGRDYQHLLIRYAT